MAAEYTTLRAGSLNARDFFGEPTVTSCRNSLTQNALDALFNLAGATSAKPDYSAIFGHLAIGAVCYVLYGLVAGLGHTNPTEAWQVSWQMPLSALLAAALCCPGLYVLARLSGATLLLWQPGYLLSGYFALSGLVLAGFAPLALLFAPPLANADLLPYAHGVVWFIGMSVGLRYVYTNIQQLGGRGGGFMLLWSGLLVAATLRLYFNFV